MIHRHESRGILHSLWNLTNRMPSRGAVLRKWVLHSLIENMVDVMKHPSCMADADRVFSPLLISLAATQV